MADIDWSQFSATPPSGHPDAIDPSQVDWSQFQTAGPVGQSKAAGPKRPDPTEGNSFLQNLMAGIGGGAVNINNRAEDASARHPIITQTLGPLAAMLMPGGEDAPAAQLTGQALANQNRMDAPLRATGGGGLGYTVPAAILTAPLGGAGGVTGMAAAGGAQAGVMGDNPLAGAAAGVAGGTIAKSLGSLFAKATGGAVDPVVLQLQKAAKDAGMPLSTGDIQAFLNRQGGDAGHFFQGADTLTKLIPFSGRNADLGKQASTLIKTGDQIGDRLAADAGGGLPEQTIGKAVRDKFAAERAIAKANYAAIDGDALTTNTTPALREVVDQFDGILSGKNISKDTREAIHAAMGDSGKSALTDTDKAMAAKFTSPNPAIMAQLEQMNPGYAQRLAVASGGDGPVAMSAADLHQTRSAIGKVLNSLDPERDGEAIRLLARAKDAATTDLEASAAGPAWQAANAHYKESVAPFIDNPLLARLANPNAADQDVLSKLGKGSFDTAAALSRNMTPEGQAALRGGLYDKVAGNAVDDSLNAGVSTARLARNLNFGDRVGQNNAAAQVFTPAQMAELANFRQLAGAARDAPAYAAQHLTGAKKIGLDLAKIGKGLLGAGGTAAAGTAAGIGAIPALLSLGGVVGGARGFNMLSTNPSFQRMVFAKGLDPNAGNLLSLLGAEGGAGLMDYLGR